MTSARDLLRRRLDRNRRELVALRTATERTATTNPLSIYERDPVGYMRDHLGLNPWEAQERIARLLLTPPYRVLVKSGHNLGKSWLCAALISWYYDTFLQCAVVTTAPTAKHVRDVLWREVRLQRRGRGFAAPTTPEMRTAPDHYAQGITARKGEAFTGRHQERMLFVLDEAVGVEPLFWETVKTMFDPGGRHAWVCIFNPTDASSQAYQEELNGGWHVVSLSALDHPNVLAGLRGEPVPYPGAVTLSQVNTWIADWCEPIQADEADATDLYWPPGEHGRWWRPGPLAECRMLGRWPSQATNGVWSDSAWAAAVRGGLHPAPQDLPVIGCDPARFGDDFTAIHVRVGPCSMHHERHHGWSLDRTHGRLCQLAREWAGWATRQRPPQAAPVEPSEIAINLDGDALGHGILDIQQALALGFWFSTVCGSGAPSDPEMFPNRRSEGWFTARKLAQERRLDLSRIPAEHLKELRRQAMAPTWKVDGAGRCVVEPKAVTKERLSCSPDDMDSVNLAYKPSVKDVYEWMGQLADPEGHTSHQERVRVFRSKR